MNTDRPGQSAAAPTGAWIDRVPLPALIATAILLGGSIGGAGFVYLEAPAWAFVWLLLFAGLGWLGYSAAPVFDEANPIQAATRPRRVVDGSLLMVELPAGSFLMGSPASDPDASSDEKLQRAVSVSAFRIAITPVTAECYQQVMAAAGDAAANQATRLPVTGVRWSDAVEFCNRLSEQAGYRRCYSRRFGRWRCDWRADGYRLPTEAEWEYACRAGSTTRYAFGDDAADLDRYAWYRGNSNNQVQPVASKRANRWGLYDMHGNVWEWCWDWYGNYPRRNTRNPRGPLKFRAGRRVLRGGSFADSPVFLRSADRDFVVPWVRNVGFRCVRVPPQHVDPSAD